MFCTPLTKASADKGLGWQRPLWVKRLKSVVNWYCYLPNCSQSICLQDQYSSYLITKICWHCYPITYTQYYYWLRLYIMPIHMYTPNSVSPVYSMLPWKPCAKWALCQHKMAFMFNSRHMCTKQTSYLQYICDAYIAIWDDCGVQTILYL